jgi:hypothetical protein
MDHRIIRITRELNVREVTPQPYQNATVVTGRFKLVGYPGTFNNEQLDTTSGEPTLELYDLIADPGETTDLAASRPEIAPGIVDLGSDAENPAQLCHYLDGNYLDGLAYGWPVCVTKPGVYRIEIDRGEADGPGRLHVERQGENLSQPVDAESNEATFAPQEGTGVIDVYFGTRRGRTRSARSKGYGRGRRR